MQGLQRDYEETVAKAEKERGALVKRVEGELTTFAQGVRRRLQDSVEPTLKGMERGARSSLRRQVGWIATFALGAVVMFGLLWMASPSGSTVVDAARWRKWQ